MRENVIFCYSGTGNCLDMAKTIARELGDTDIVPVRIGFQSRIHALKGAQSYPEADFFFILADVRQLPEQREYAPLSYHALTPAVRR